jgi:hypothetical protein
MLVPSVKDRQKPESVLYRVKFSRERRTIEIRENFELPYYSLTPWSRVLLEKLTSLRS